MLIFSRVGIGWADRKRFFAIGLFGTIDEHSKSLCRAFSLIGNFNLSQEMRDNSRKDSEK
jgi:hypothetical protein